MVVTILSQCLAMMWRLQPRLSRLQIFGTMNIDIIDNKLELSNTQVNKDSVFKYFNEYYGYKFNIN